MVTVRDEIDRVPDPHWTAVVTVGPGEFLDGVVSEVHDRDRVCSPASIVTPIAALEPLRNELHRDLLECQPGAVRRICSCVSAWHRQGLGHPPVNVNRPEPVVCLLRLTDTG